MFVFFAAFGYPGLVMVLFTLLIGSLEASRIGVCFGVDFVRRLAGTVHALVLLVVGLVSGFSISRRRWIPCGSVIFTSMACIRLAWKVIKKSGVGMCARCPRP